MYKQKVIYINLLWGMLYPFVLKQAVNETDNQNSNRLI